MTDASAAANTTGHEPHDAGAPEIPGAGVPAEPYNATITDWVDLNKELSIFRVKPD